MTQELFEQISNTAWANKTTNSELVRSAINTLIEDPSQLAGWGDDPGNGTKRLTFILPDEQWEAITHIAWSNRMSIVATIRIALNKAING